MLNYEEELKKFKPCLDVDEVEDAIYSRDLTDVIDRVKALKDADVAYDNYFERNDEKRQAGTGKRDRSGKGRVRCRNELYEL